MEQQENKILEKNITVDQYVYHWIKIHKPYIKNSTYATYLSNIENHIIPYFKSMKLDNITVDINQEFILFLCKKGRLNSTGGLSIKMVKDIMSIWLSILKLAKEEHIIDLQEHQYYYHKKDNLYFSIQKSKCLSIEQEIKVMNFLKKNPTIKNIGIMMSLSTGIRIGEICALRWKNIDLNNRVIYITETLQRIYLKNANKETAKGTSKIIISNPKSNKSIRIIPLADYLIKILIPLKKQDNCFFLTGRADKWMEPRTYRDYYSRLLKKQKLLFVSFHGLRHTFATIAIQ